MAWGFSQQAIDDAMLFESSIFSIPLNDELMRPVLRLFEALESAKDTAVLSDLILDEINYRLLCHEEGAALRTLLQQRGQIQRITRAVDHIHQNQNQL